MRWYCARTVNGAPPPDRAAVTHCNKFLRDTASRHAVRMIASSMFAAVSARKTNDNPICFKASDVSLPKAAKWLRSVTPSRLGRMPKGSGSKRGSASIAITTIVQTAATAGGISQPANSVANAIGASSERRRLSIIFQRPTTGMPPSSRRFAPNIHGRSCQSPRAQR